MKKYYKTMSWSSYDLPKVLEERGVHDAKKLPGFHYRDDALKLWQAIREYIKDILIIYYHSDEKVQSVSKLPYSFSFLLNLNPPYVKSAYEPSGPSGRSLS